MGHTIRNKQGGSTDNDFWSQWGSSNPRMCLCIRITSKSAFGITKGFTTNSRSMTLPGHSGVTFVPTSAITPTIIEQSLDEPSVLEINGAYENAGLTQFQVMAGVWHFARVEVFSVCWDNTNLGEFLHFDGNMGEVRDYITYFAAEARGKISRLSNDVNKVTQRLCRCKEFRDAECGHTASTITVNGTAYNVTQTGLTSIAEWSTASAFVTIPVGAGTANRPPAGFYANGKLECTSGNNDGHAREIAYNDSASGGSVNLYLKRAFPTAVTIGDQFTLTAGCDRTIEACMERNNIVNRRAEDFIPGIEAIMRLPTVTAQ